MKSTLINKIMKVADDNIHPIPLNERTTGVGGAFFLWFGITFTMVVMFTGYYFIPTLGFWKSSVAVILGSILGGIPFLTISLIGQKTGLPTTTLSRGTFGVNGSFLPAVLNIISLSVWTFLPSEIAGNALNYISKRLLGYDNLKLYIILSLLLVFVVTIFGYKRVEKIEKVVMVVMIAGVCYILYKEYSLHGTGFVDTVVGGNAEDITFGKAIDMVAIYILAYTGMAADYNRNCKEVAGAISSTLGVVFGTSLIILSGMILICVCQIDSIAVEYNPALIFGALGVGFIGSILIFASNSALNFAAVYSVTMSVMNIFPKVKYPFALTIVVAVCMAGALFAGILGHVVTFVSFLGNLYAPLFAIIMVDYFFIKCGSYDADELLKQTPESRYFYWKGINVIAFVAYIISAGITCVWSFIYVPPVGAVIPGMLASGILYIAIYKLAYRPRKTDDKIYYLVPKKR